MCKLLRLFFCCLCAVSAAPAYADPVPEFPDGFPEEMRGLKFREKEAKLLAPGVTYYHFHFDNLIPKDVSAVFTVCTVTFSGSEAEEQAKDMRKEIKKAKKKLNLNRMAKEWKAQARSRTFLELPGDSPLAKLKKPGDMTEIENDGKKCSFHVLSSKFTQFPVSVYYIIIDWEKANVRLGLEQSGGTLKTVREMVEPHKPLAAINGAYFTFVPPRTFYPLKINGKMYEPKPGYDSRDGLCFSGNSFPVLDKEANFDKYDNVIMGYYVWKNGKYALDAKLEKWQGILSGGSPLTAVGLNPENKQLVLFTSDGRFPKDAPGLNFYSEGFFLTLVGCTEVLSIDGGGSCTMLIREKKKLSGPMNHPSDNGKFDHNGARSVQNCIYLVENE